MALDHSRLGLEKKFLENKSGQIFLPSTGLLYAPINVNPVGGGGGSAGKGRGFDAWDYPRCRAFDRVKRLRGRDI